MKHKYKVERLSSPNIETSWYECMLSPFNTFEEATAYIEKYRNYYPLEYQNYKITCQIIDK